MNFHELFLIPRKNIKINNTYIKYFDRKLKIGIQLKYFKEQ